MKTSIALLAVLVTLVPALVTAQSRPAPAATSAPSLVSLSAGAIVVKKPQEFDDKWAAIWMLDERKDTGWATPKGVVGPQTIVIALPEQTILKDVIFDNSMIDGPGRGAKDVTVEMSNTSDTAGFQRIAQVALAPSADNQRFPVAAEVPGRWVRLTVTSNHGSAEYVELFDFRATGTQLTRTPFPDISGTYATNYNDFHVRQQGASVTGCYEYKSGVLAGGIDGRVISFTWRETTSEGPAILVFTPDGDAMFGLWWNKDATARGTWHGTRKSREVGNCTHWAGGVQEQITKDLEEAGRSRLYGINFDTDSDRIRPESTSTLDKIVGVLKAKPDWRLKIEGHTDATGTAQHNQTLSERRAVAVKRYLQAAGIDEARLTTEGFGATRPVAYDDGLGRAQNRRVELTKQP